MKDHFGEALEKKKQAHIRTALYRIKELEETPAQAIAKLRENSTLGTPVWAEIQVRVEAEAAKK